jgi:hypothetical protein
MREGALASRIIAAWGTGFYYLAGEARDIQRCVRRAERNVSALCQRRAGTSIFPHRAFFSA